LTKTYYSYKYSRELKEGSRMANLFDIKLVFSQIPELLQFLPVTLELTAVAAIVGLVLGLLIALVRINNIPVLKQIAVVFVSVIRGTPALVQLYIIYYGIPIALKYFNYYNGTDYNIYIIPSIVFAMIALGLNQSAFDSETIRAALQSVDRGQIEAAKAMGMTGFQVLSRVIIPEAVTVALPSLGNSLISLIKGTSLAFTCSVVEMTAQGKIIGGRTYRYFEVYCSLAIIYWVITLFLEQVLKFIEKKMEIPADLPERDQDGKIIKSKKKKPVKANA
jgi:polar amino acid transport system permease protein